jgi:hypothetical protein
MNQAHQVTLIIRDSKMQLRNNNAYIEEMSELWLKGSNLLKVSFSHT